MKAKRAGFDFGGAMRRAGVIAAVLYLALVQVLSAAHAVSGDADAPKHDSGACVLCVTAHGVAHGIAPSVFVPSAPIEIFLPPPPATVLFLVPVRTLAPAPRGPPTF